MIIKSRFPYLSFLIKNIALPPSLFKMEVLTNQGNTVTSLSPLVKRLAHLFFFLLQNNFLEQHHLSSTQQRNMKYLQDMFFYTSPCESWYFPGSVQGQHGQDPERPGLVEGVHACGRGTGNKWSLSSLSTQTICDGQLRCCYSHVSTATLSLTHSKSCPFSYYDWNYCFWKRKSNTLLSVAINSIIFDSDKIKTKTGSVFWHLVYLPFYQLYVMHPV